MSQISTLSEVIPVSTASVACEGGGGALGHPRVFLTFGEKQTLDCPYCGQRYEYVPPSGTASLAQHAS